MAQVLDLVLEAAVLDGLLDLQLHLLDLERLLHVVERADLHRLDGRVDRSERRHQDDARSRGAGPWPCAARPAVAAAHLQIAQDDVVLPFVQLLDGDVAVRRLVHFVVRVRQRADDAAPQRIVIVCNQNPSHVSPSSSAEQPLLARHRQRDPERRAAPCRAADIDSPVVRVDDLAHDREPEP